ncbi:unnamed protein product [Orchesella dallaii]|uniref:Peptidase S1 domain-containing protein n=1 Tax=Orchesella dallaii TaxID=48710 RepID=A0ABP1S7V0_9HEXA
MAKPPRHFSVAVTCIVILFQLIDVNCQLCNFSNGSHPCPDGYNEIYRAYMKNGKMKHRGCCHRNASDTEKMKIAGKAEGCQTAPCAPHQDQTTCEYLDDFVVNGTLLVYEETKRETCSNQMYHSGYRAYCCRPDSLEEALVSTYGAEPNEFPHMVGVSIRGHVCGGTIYNKRYIITAAHCVVNPATRTVTPVHPRKNYKVIIGTNLWSNDSPQNVYGVEQVIAHEGYSKKEGSAELQKLVTEEISNVDELRTYNDIALLRLDRDITFGPTVKALRLAESGFNPLDYAKTAVIAGWGTGESGRVIGYLQKANSVISSDEMCFQISDYKRFGELRDQLICLGGIVDGEYSPRTGEGDSGGPAICRRRDGKPVLCGIASFSIIRIECIRNEVDSNCHPGVFAEVAHFKKWIEENIPEGQDEETLFNGPLHGTPVSAPHQVRITSGTGKSCGGTLIQSDIVVTAAHCIMDDETTLLGDVKVITSQGITLELEGTPAVMPGFKKLQKPYISAENTKPGVERVVMRDNFYENDLAILRLKQNVPGVIPDQLPRLPEPYEKPQGAAMEFSVSTDAPQNGFSQRNFNILYKAECQKRMNRLGMLRLKSNVSDNIICGVEQYSGGSTCDRSLGGGLICEGNVLCGVQSFRLCEWALPNSFVDMSQWKGIVEKAIKVLRDK